ncbi:hypothetical protein E3N88_09581 [Mikania micrantha]|uniref:Uncharacterized protein n=1 Tax=Mikania micrantha TaxID=192012 RepID=A0A5N6PMJ5_9ASTR|nr:hypothetical protein E3N88_09581 [Mikania micrantha]
MEVSSSSNPGSLYPYPSHVTMELSGRDTSMEKITCTRQRLDSWVLSNQTLKYLVNSFPDKYFTAKDAWDKLQTIYGPPVTEAAENYSDMLATTYGPPIEAG